MLAWKDYLRVIIGSGNLTEPGYRKNVEVFGTIELSRAGGGARSAVLSVIDFLEEIVEGSVGADTPHTPKRRALTTLEQLRAHVKPWPETRDALTGIPVFNSPARSALHSLGELWTGPPARQAHVVSPFFDHPPDDGRAIDGLRTLLAKRGDVQTFFYVKTESLLDGRTRVYAPRRIADPTRAGETVDIVPLSGEQRGEIREVHSKLLSLGNDDSWLLMIGSSNFTAAGLGVVPGKGNFEANLVFKVRAADPAFKQLDLIWPDYTDSRLDAASPTLLWEPSFEDQEDGEGTPPLPAGFEEALFTPGGEASLTITLAFPLPVRNVLLEAAWSADQTAC